MDDKIMVGTEDLRRYDKMQIALAIRNSTYEEELHCSVLSNGLLKNCQGCSLQGICEKIDQVAADYFESSSKVVMAFTFH